MKYIFIVFIFFSCKNIYDPNANRTVSREVLDIIKDTLPVTRAAPAIFEKAFLVGTQDQVNQSTVTFYGVNIGKIKVSSGRIIACDPMHIDEYGIPFTQAFPTGEFAVQLSIAKLEDEESIAFARILFSQEPVVRWQLALQKGQTPLPVGAEKIHGYSVDAGVGIFIDEAASKALDKRHVTRMDQGVYQEMDKHYHNTWRYALYSFGNHNLAAFTSGFGDGYYASYIGYDTNGKPCRLLTDFGLSDWKQNKL
jgi:hypothetical protein